MSLSPKHFYDFDRFRIDPRKRRLLDGGEPVSLTPKAFETLLVLVENRGRVLEKDVLMKLLWPDTIVEEANLSVNVSALRKALGESPSENRYIATIPGRGYSFVADVQEVREDNGRPAAPDVEPPIAPSAAAEVESVSGGPRRGMALAAGVAAVLGLGVLLWYALFRTAPSGSEPLRTVAILPFRPIGEPAPDDYLGLGLADSLITALSRIHQLEVRPTSAVRRYSALDQDAQAAGRELRVEAVLDGTYLRTGERIRVTARLVRVADGRPLWADRFEERFTDLFTVEDSIAERVAASLIAKLTGEERRLLTKHYTVSSDAYQLYLKGRYHWNKRTIEGLRRGAEHFKEAIALDPAFASAHAGLADSYSLLGIQEAMHPREAFSEARRAAERALEIDSGLAEAHASLAHIRLHQLGWDDSEREFRRALDLGPNYPVAHHWYTEYLSATGRHDRALEEERRAESLDPLSLVISTDVGWHLYFAGRYADAAAQLRKALDLDPRFPLARLRLGQVYEREGKLAEAIAELERARSLAPDSPEIAASLGSAYALSGKRRAALGLADTAAAERRGYVSSYFAARLYLSLGDRDRALGALEKAEADGSGWLVFLAVEPAFAPLRSEPRFDALLRRAGLQKEPGARSQ